MGQDICKSSKIPPLFISLLQVGIMYIHELVADHIFLPSGMFYPIATPNAVSGAQSLLGAVTTANEFYYIAACNLVGQYTKLFLMKNNPEGLETLKSTALQKVVTGGEVTDCALVALTNGAKGYSAR